CRLLICVGKTVWPKLSLVGVVDRVAIEILIRGRSRVSNMHVYVVEFARRRGVRNGIVPIGCNVDGWASHFIVVYKQMDFAVGIIMGGKIRRSCHVFIQHGCSTSKWISNVRA